MYGYEWTNEYGIFRLTIDAKLQKEIRPVFREELDFFEMYCYWDYPRDTDAPLLWAEGVRRYVMNGTCVAEAKGGGFYTKPTIELKTDERLQLQPIDVNRLYEVNKTLMISLEQKAVHFIQEQYEKYKKQGYAFICAFSGGKDSIVLLDLCAKALAPSDFYVVFSNTGMELSDTIRAVEKAKEHWAELHFEEAKCHMDPSESWEEFGPPASKLRWCCSVHKSVPTILLLQQLTGENARAVVFDGVRAEESARRAKYTEVGEGVKNALQINCHAILKWDTAEVFVYILHNNLMINNAYRHGIYRVGCMVCPMSAKWQDSLIAHNYHDEMATSLSLIEDLTMYAKGKLDKKYVEDGGWQVRAGGKILKQGENRIAETIEDGKLIIDIKNARQSWNDVVGIFGHIVEEKDDKKYVLSKHGICEMTLTVDEAGQHITIYPITRLDRFDIASLRAVANKTAYCVGCKACVPQCPTNAFQIIDGKIHIREKACVHCYNCCMYTDKGCMVAKSLYIRSDTVKNPDRYRNFGLRQSFYSHLTDNGLDCFGMTVLGKDQYKSLRYWMGDANILKREEKNNKEQILVELTPLGEKLLPMGSYNPFVWAILWANLAYDSIVVRCFCLKIGAGEMFQKDDLIEWLDRDISEKSRGQAVNSLLSTFRDSPIGSALGQGIVVDKSYFRAGWDYPDPVALLYSLYLYAERTGHKSFTFSELVNSRNVENAGGVSPHDIYGIDAKAFKEQVQGLAVQYPKYIRVSFVANLDNIVLEDFASQDILDLAED